MVKVKISVVCAVGFQEISFRHKIMHSLRPDFIFFGKAETLHPFIRLKPRNSNIKRCAVNTVVIHKPRGAQARCALCIHCSKVLLIPYGIYRSQPKNILVGKRVYNRYFIYLNSALLIFRRNACHGRVDSVVFKLLGADIACTDAHSRRRHIRNFLILDTFKAEKDVWQGVRNKRCKDHHRENGYKHEPDYKRKRLLDCGENSAGSAGCGCRLNYPRNSLCKSDKHSRNLRADSIFHHSFSRFSFARVSCCLSRFFSAREA